MNEHPTPAHDEVEPLLNYAEVADILAVSERTVSTLVGSGQLRSVRFGRVVRIDPADLRSFIAASKPRDAQGGAR